MKITNCLKPCGVSRRKNVRLLVAFGFCAVSLVALGCQSTGSNSCCPFKSNDPEKLATVSAPSSDSTSRGQSSDVSSVSVPSEESQERHDKFFTGAQQNVPQATTDSASSLATTGSSTNAPIVESLDSTGYMANTSKPTDEPNVPNVTGVPAALPQVPSDENVEQNSTQASTPAEQNPTSGGYVSVAPSANQGNQGTSGEHGTNSVAEPTPNSSPDVPTSDAKIGEPEPPVEMTPEKSPTTFAEETASTDGAVKSEETSSDAAVQGNAASGRSNETAPTQTPKETTVDPTLDTSVPVTFKQTAYPRVVEIRPTRASDVVDSNVKASQQSVKRAANNAGLIVPGAIVGKPINVSKDSARLTSIPRR